MIPLKPWFIKKKKLWVCKYRGKRIYLCAGKNTPEDRQRAMSIMFQKCAGYIDVRLGDCNKLEHFAAYYFEREESRHAPSGWRNVVYAIKAFVKRWPKLHVSDLLPLHLQTFLDERKVGNNKYNYCVTVINGMFNWGVKQGILTRNPVAGVAHKPSVTKTLECLVTDDLHDKLMTAAGAEGRRILEALKETGCRPGELQLVQKHHYNPEIRAWVFADGEAKTENRKVYLSKKMVVLTEKLIDRGRDYLFRNPKTKKPWANPKGTEFARWFNAIKRRAKIDNDELTAYSYRHTFGTSLIMKDVSINKIAELMGHTSIKTLQRWYNHLKGQHEALLDVLDKVSA